MKNVSPVLLVEDNPDDELLTVRALRKADVPGEIVVARDGLEALNYLFGEGEYAGRDTAGQPAVVLLDLKLPKLDGIEVLRRMRHDPRTRLLPVVILSTSREPRDVLNAALLGANSYIRKPVNYEEFVRTVQQIASYWLVLNEPIPKANGIPANVFLEAVASADRQEQQP